ncbi:glutamine-dependent NAD(+) synthetase [Geranomyces variabilis]|nr:glutamine-dependent NAD(+) synthetase [Geranomyces variabilis]
MGHYITLATCVLNQWALDFQGNYERILESIKLAKEAGARYRLGPELEITGYGCNDHFYEGDTYLHSFEVLAKLLVADVCQDMLIDVGMPVAHKNTKYNCRVMFLNKKILLIRPKMYLANDGNYREMRWFASWKKHRTLEDFYLPRIISAITEQHTVPFGDGVISARDTVLGTEMCEELFTPDSPHIHQALDGVEIFTNSSGSHHEFRKLDTRIELIRGATRKSGGIYLYANQQGCDGERVYYDGCGLIVMNGEIVAQGTQFSLKDVEVVTATVDIEDLRSRRGDQPSRMAQATEAPAYPRVFADIALTYDAFQDGFDLPPTAPRPPFYHTPEEEIRYGPACWLWDYLRRAKAGGFFLPLSGGLDSCCTAIIVYSMCDLVCKSAKNGDAKVIADARRIAGEPADSTYVPVEPKEFSGRIFHTCYMGTENSSKETRNRAKHLAEWIGSCHVDINMDSIVSAFLTVFQIATGKVPQYKVRGGTETENLALQNIQARSRMVLAYMFAQLLLWIRGRPGSLLVLGSANVDETLRGYFTKYDCSSADVNPVGGISKTDLRKFVQYSKTHLGLGVLQEFLDANPTAELEPITSDYVQGDEVDMKMTYEELSIYGTLRKVAKCGPFGMFSKLIHQWSGLLSPTEIAEKVKSFFFYYSINRHKTTILPPSYHMSPYSPDDNRFDLRPFLYNSSWTWQFRRIDEGAAALSKLSRHSSNEKNSETSKSN